MTVTRRLFALGSALILTGSLAACSSDTPTAQTTPTPTTSAPALPMPSTPANTGGTATSTTCAAADQAKLALSDVKDVDILKEGTDAFKAKVDTLQTDIDAAVAAAKTEYAPQADAVKESMEALKAAVGTLGTSPSADTVKAVGTALDSVGTSFTQLTSAMDEAC